MALLERRRHKHDIIAKTRCRVLVLDSESLMHLTRRHPEILDYMKQVANERKQSEAAARGVGRKRKPRASAGAESDPVSGSS
jgi:voltage-gated potassium channel